MTSESAHQHHHDYDHDHDHPNGIRGVLMQIFVPHSHDAADSVDTALETSAVGIRAVKISLIGLGAIAAVQLVVAIVSGSIALAADTIHNFSDALTAVPLWIAFAVGRRPATRRYTYGFGRAEDLAGIFVIGMISLSAASWLCGAKICISTPRMPLGWSWSWSWSW